MANASWDLSFLLEGWGREKGERDTRTLLPIPPSVPPTPLLSPAFLCSLTVTQEEEILLILALSWEWSPLRVPQRGVLYLGRGSRAHLSPTAGWVSGEGHLANLAN